MEALLQNDFDVIEEIRILSDVRLVGHRDLNPLNFTEYLKVQFELKGDLNGHVFCCLDLTDKDLTVAEKNYLLPLFLESMNILLGQQVSAQGSLSGSDVRLSPPKIVSSKTAFTSNGKSSPVQKYSLELRTITFDVAVEYLFTRLN